MLPAISFSSSLYALLACKLPSRRALFFICDIKILFAEPRAYSNTYYVQMFADYFLSKNCKDYIGNAYII